MTTLTNGSEKQIAWATDIKADMIARFTAYIDAGIAGSPEAERAGLREQWAPFQAAVVGINDAKWWIDHRYEITSMERLGHDAAKMAGLM